LHLSMILSLVLILNFSIILCFWGMLKISFSRSWW
jgi:hypothetical protein